ncbi:hypothetical protein [Agrobacterium sp. CG674]
MLKDISNKYKVALIRYSGAMAMQDKVRNEAEPDKTHFWVVSCMGCLFGGWVAAHFTLVSIFTKEGAEKEMGFESAITIVLSALSIIITVLAIIIAVVGTIGFNTLRRAAFDAGTKHAVAQMADGGEIRKILLERVDELVANAGFKPVPESAWGNSEKEYGE